ncbi:hypothetical protein RDI58_022481 [Solanum bulbocastanum]|uniref:Uncharacterized protein n=1 Tax=Solanum bulbocastanum TaxID=147425 RepID=A0AAN8Y5T6_SOLBU
MCPKKKEVEQLHGQLILNGLIRCFPNVAKLIESYVDVDALLVLKSSIQSPDTFSYNIMIRGMILIKRPMEPLFLYEGLVTDELLPDSHTYTFVLKACFKLKAVLEEHDNVIYPLNSMITNYMNERLVEEPIENLRSSIQWEIRMKLLGARCSGYVKNGMHEDELLTG